MSWGFSHMVSLFSRIPEAFRRTAFGHSQTCPLTCDGETRFAISTVKHPTGRRCRRVNGEDSGGVLEASEPEKSMENG